MQSIRSKPSAGGALPTPVIETTSTSSQGSKTSLHSVTMPAGVTSGDELVMIFVEQDGTITLPTGWTQLYNAGSPSTQASLLVCRRTSDGTEGASVTVTTSTGSRSNHIVYRLSGAGATEASTGATATSTAPNADSLTPSGGAKNYMWLVAFGQKNATVSAFPTSYSGGINSSTASDCNAASCQRELNAASEDPAAATITASAEWRAVTLAVPPA